jgi:acetolactate synthase-1/3 small subunit
VVDAPDAVRGRIEANLYKLLDVERVESIPPDASVDRDLAMIKVAATSASRGEVMQLVDVFRARVVDVAPDSLIVEITGTEDKIDGLLDVLRPYGVIEMVRTGRVSMLRGGQELKAARRRPRAGAEAGHQSGVSYSV